MKYILKYVLTFIGIIAIFVTLLFVTCLFPSEYIKKNVKNSSETLEKEGNIKRMFVIEKLDVFNFDNYSDSLMINTVYSIDNSTPLYSSFIARKNYIPNLTEKVYEDTTGELNSASKFKVHDEVNELKDVVNGNINESFEYARYWHGYITILRPILLIFNLSTIRIILTIAFLFLAIIVLFNIYKKLGIFYMITFLLGLIGIEYFYMGVSIQGCFVFLITMILMEIILTRFEKIKDISIYFFITGMITNFLDLLTNPLVTLGLPLILYFILIQKNNKLTIKDSILIFVKTCVPWLLGYAITWITKWILVDILYNKGLIKTALSQILYRTRGVTKLSSSSVIAKNLFWILIPLQIDIFAFMIILVLNIKKGIQFSKFKETILTIFPYLIISIMPYLWYIILKNHSYLHSFFTYRNQILILITIPIIYYKVLNLDRIKE